MQYRKLGGSGLKVRAISLGSWITFGGQIDLDSTEACMTAAYDAGINFFDGAEVYAGGQAEQAMGEVLKRTGWRRETLIISTKIFHAGGTPTEHGLSRKHLVEGVDNALKRMNLEYVDLCFCHMPDPETPAEEIVHTMNDLIRRGKIFYWGTSNHGAAELFEMYRIAERDRLVPPTMEQSVYNMHVRHRLEGELKPVFDRYPLGTTIYSPLCQGVLTGKYNEGIPEGSRAAYSENMRNAVTEERVEKTRQLTPIAEQLGLSMAQLALAWTLKNPNVSTAIIGATRPDQVADNVGAADAVEKLTDEVMDRIEGILDNKP
jgi:voltage-dependent potassium channel beta subunit